MLSLLQQAAQIALPTSKNDKRSFWLGCVGIRDDGVLVRSKNGSASFSETVNHYQLIPSSHAEGRVLAKLGCNGTLYVARVSKEDGSLKMARACGMCSVRIKSFKVKKVYYTINSEQYGIWEVKKDIHTVFEY